LKLPSLSNTMCSLLSGDLTVIAEVNTVNC
jgi:hypothetical protein